MDSLRSICTICNSPTERKCTTCDTVRYCSTECEHTDKSVHATLCYENPHPLGRPSPNHRRAIFFPTRDSPSFVWVECSNDSQQPRAVLEGFINAAPQNPPTEKLLKENHLRRRYLNPEMVVYSQHRGNMWTLPANLIIRTVAQHQTPVCQTREWWGPVLVLGVKTQQNLIESFEDLEITNLRDVLDYLCFQVAHLPPIPAHIAFEPLPKVKGVKICCYGDWRFLHKSKYSSVTVPLDHAVFYSRTSPISTMVGLPMFMSSSLAEHDPQEHTSRVTSIMDLSANKEASALQMNMDPCLNTLGMIPPEWQQGVGNVVIVRQDHRDLDPQHVEALVEYVRDNVSARLARSRITALGTFNMQDFAKFFGELEEDNSCVDWAWLDVRSPF